MLQGNLQCFAQQLTILDTPSMRSRPFAAIANLTIITVQRHPFFQLS